MSEAAGFSHQHCWFSSKPDFHPRRFERYLPLLRRFICASAGKPWTEQLQSTEPAPFQWASPLRWDWSLSARSEAMVKGERASLLLIPLK